MTKTLSNNQQRIRKAINAKKIISHTEDYPRVEQNRKRMMA